ncbi:MAG: polyprenyl synthetase family protein [Candidatus Moranbacteria bacterium]|nr:polyprenyl synthetase family protein [Candidatus Moranbacteria bacterium]
MRIETELKVFKERLDPKIGAYFDKAIEEANKEDAFVTDALRYGKTLMLAGGKRLRAAFMYYGYLGAGGTEEEKLLSASMSIEFIHAFLLVHDDIIDQDDMRHGVATFHRHYADIGEKLFPGKDKEHFGDAIAIIMGDMLGAFGNDIIFSSDFPLERKFQALTKLQKIVSYTVIGQARDIYMEFKGEASEEEILSMYRNKTARYTVEGPLHLGAILAGASQEILDGLSAYAIPLGIAFQIQDDILGIYGTAKRLGKPIGSDIEEGKITLLVSRALRDGSVEQKKRLTEILSLGEKLTEKDIEEFRELIKMTGAYDGTKALALGYIEEGKQALKALEGKLQPRAYDFLFSVAEYMMGREY